MKTIFTLILSLLLGLSAWACTWNPQPFCNSVDSSHTLIYGRIVDTIPHGTRVEVLNVYRGVETRDTVTVWNAMYFCMETVEVSLGNYGIGNSVFFIMPKVDSSEYGWDIVGDYIMNVLEEKELVLRLDGDTVLGFISGTNLAPPLFQYNVYAYHLDGFKAWLDSAGSCNDLITVSINEVSAFDAVAVYPNPTNDYVAIKNLPMGATVELLSLNGQHISTIEANAEHISTSHLAAGTYLLKINYQGETGYRRIVKL